jgi:N-acetylglucosaminyl-diphospho-decaprenol L-rhamnosyltransferase
LVSLPISIIIVTHNHAAYIGQCLDALVPEVSRIGGEVIVIDNRSDDASAALTQQYSSVQLHINSTRQGFSANNNYGMALAKGRYLLLLNPDTEVKPNALKTLIQFMDTHSEVGMCAAQLLFPDGTIQPSPRRFPSIGSVLARRTPLRFVLWKSKLNQYHLMKDLDHSKIQAVDWLLGACMFIRREVLDTVGPLDEGYFLYVEDIDWARRMHDSDWQIYYVPTAQIIHHHIAVSDKKLLSWYMWTHIQSMIRYTRKFILPSIPLLSVHSICDEVWQTTQLAPSDSSQLSQSQ